MRHKTYNYEVRIIRESSVGCMPCATMKESENFIKDHAENYEWKIVYKNSIAAWKNHKKDPHTDLWMKE